MLVTAKARTSDVGQTPSTQTQHVEEGYYTDLSGVGYDPSSGSYFHRVVNGHHKVVLKFEWPKELDTWLTK